MNLRPTITGISSMATRLLLADLADEWRAVGGADLHVESTGGVDAARRVANGEAFDLAVLASDAIDTLASVGRVRSASVTPLVKSPVAVAVRRGHAAPAIDDEAALRRAVLSAGSVGYSTGPSGVALMKLFERWEIVDQIRARLLRAPPGTPVGELLARGEVELGFQQLSELMHLNGVAVIGPMPPGIEIVTTFSGAVCASAKMPEGAEIFLKFVQSAAAADTKRRHGMQPVRPKGAIEQ